MATDLINPISNIGNISGTVSLPTGAATSANQTTANSSLSSIDGKLPALGQALSGASIPVVLPATQITALTPPSTVAISSLPSLPAGSNAIGSITNTSFAATQSGTWNITNISGTVSLPTGAATSANQTTANTSLSSIDGKLPASLGAKSPANSISVTQAFAATSTLTNVASSATSVSLLAANNNRKTAIILNDSTSDLYVTLNASAASTTNYSLFLAAKVGNTPSFLAINGDDYSGEIRGIWSSANGFARITEVV